MTGGEVLGSFGVGCTVDRKESDVGSGKVGWVSV